MSSKRSIHRLLIALLFISCFLSIPQVLEAQNAGVKPLSGNALDYLFQNPAKWSGSKFPESHKFLDRLYLNVGGGVGNLWSYEDDLSNSVLGYQANLMLGYRLSPVHSLELGAGYQSLFDFEDDVTVNFSYLFDVVGYASKLSDPGRVQLFLKMGVESHVTTPEVLSLDGAMRFQYNVTPSVGLYLEPQVSYYAFAPSENGVSSYHRGDAYTSLSFGASFNIGNIRKSYIRYLDKVRNPLEYEDRPLIAFKSNLLYDAVSVLNVELEVPIKRRWSIAGEWICPWWKSSSYSSLDSSRNTVQLLHGNLEGKYWFGDRYKHSVMTGWFAGIYSGGGVYDLESDGIGYQGDFFIAAGLSGGYAHSIIPGGNLRLEYSLGVGYLQTDYTQYKSFIDSDDVWHSIEYQAGRYKYFGPTKLRVSLVWLLNHKVKIGGSK